MSKLARVNRAFRYCVPRLDWAAWALGLMLCAVGTHIGEMV
jgi:hypothetical protein